MSQIPEWCGAEWAEFCEIWREYNEKAPGTRGPEMEQLKELGQVLADSAQGGFNSLSTVDPRVVGVSQHYALSNIQRGVQAINSHLRTISKNAPTGDVVSAGFTEMAAYLGTLAEAARAPVSRAAPMPSPGLRTPHDTQEDGGLSPSNDGFGMGVEPAGPAMEPTKSRGKKKKAAPRTSGPIIRAFSDDEDEDE